MPPPRPTSSLTSVASAPTSTTSTWVPPASMTSSPISPRQEPEHDCTNNHRHRHDQDYSLRGEYEPGRPPARRSGPAQFAHHRPSPATADVFIDDAHGDADPVQPGIPQRRE